MKKLTFLVMLIALGCALACDPTRPAAKEKFSGPSGVRIMVCRDEADGSRWFVSWDFMDVWRVSPAPEATP